MKKFALGIKLAIVLMVSANQSSFADSPQEPSKMNSFEKSNSAVLESESWKKYQHMWASIQGLKKPGGGDKMEDKIDRLESELYITFGSKS